VAEKPVELASLSTHASAILSQRARPDEREPPQIDAEQLRDTTRHEARTPTKAVLPASSGDRDAPEGVDHRLRGRRVTVKNTWAKVIAIGGAVDVRVRVGHTTTAQADASFVWIVRTLVPTIWGAVRIAIGIGNATTTLTWVDFCCIVRAKIHTVRHGVAICVQLADATSTEAHRSLIGIIWTFVLTIIHGIAVRVDGRGNATTKDNPTGVRSFVRNARTFIVTIHGAVAISVHVGHSTTAHASHNLSGVRGTSVKAIQRTVTVSVNFRDATST
jgi:hypothetical protein